MAFAARNGMMVGSRLIGLSTRLACPPRNLSRHHRVYATASSTGGMGKRDLVDAVADAAGLQKKEAERAVNAMLDTIVSAVSQGQKVTITGFGSFARGERAARQGRNPRTGEPLDIPASKYPAFSAGKNFKEAVKAPEAAS